MVNRYAPLQLPANPGAMPQDYHTKITYFDGTNACTALHHTKKMQDYFESDEIDDDSVRMKIFVQSLTGDVRTWFRALPANSIGDPEPYISRLSMDGRKRKTPCTYYLSMTLLKEALRRLFWITVQGSIMFIMQYHRT